MLPRHQGKFYNLSYFRKSVNLCTVVFVYKEIDEEGWVSAANIGFNNARSEKIIFQPQVWHNQSLLDKEKDKT